MNSTNPTLPLPGCDAVAESCSSGFRSFAVLWLAALWVGSLVAPAHGANSFANTGVLAAARHLHTSTLRPSGKVLVVGGNGGSVTSVARNSMIPSAGRTASDDVQEGWRQHRREGGVIVDVVRELYNDVAVCNGAQRPSALGFKTEEIRRTITIDA